MGTVLKRWCAGTFLVAVVTFGTIACSSGDVPPTLSDDERARLVDRVEEQSSWIESPSCQVEVFRQDGDTTYGWADCMTSASASASEQELLQGESYPFRIDGDQIRVPGDGGAYEEDLKEIFPEDLRAAIEEHSVGLP